MQKLNSIQGYARIKEGQGVAFECEDYLANEPRRIKMRINTAVAVVLYATRLDDVFDENTGELIEDVRLLAHVGPGFDEIEFAYIGNFKVEAVGGDIWLDTLDAAQFVVQATDFESYARVFERQEEDPVLAEIKYMARQNQRLLEQQRQQDRAEREALLAEIQKYRDTQNVASASNPSAAPAASPAPVVAPVGASSGDEAASAASGGNDGVPDGNG